MATVSSVLPAIPPRFNSLREMQAEMLTEEGGEELLYD
jgi:hypothetical protein